MRHKVQRKRVIVRDEDVPSGSDWGDVMRAVGGRHFPDLKKHGAAWTFPSHQLDTFQKLVAPSGLGQNQASTSTNESTTIEQEPTDESSVGSNHASTDGSSVEQEDLGIIPTDNSSVGTQTDTEQASVDQAVASDHASVGTQTDTDEPSPKRYKHDVDEDVYRFVSDWLRQAGLDHLSISS